MYIRLVEKHKNYIFYQSHSVVKQVLTKDKQIEISLQILLQHLNHVTNTDT